MPDRKKSNEQRVFWVTILVLAVISTLGWLRFQQALRLWYYLIDLNVQPPPIYLAASGALIGLSHSLGFFFHVFKKPYTRVYLRVINALLLLWLWVDRVFFVIRDFFSLLLAGMVSITIILIVCDLYLYRHITYKKKVSENAPEN